MALMTKTRLTMAVHNCPGTLERLYWKMPDAAFMTAVKNYDADAANDILESAICRILGTGNLSLGLEQYCRRFGIEEDLSRLDDIDRILLIEQYRGKIDRQLRDAGV